MEKAACLHDREDDLQEGSVPTRKITCKVSESVHASSFPVPQGGLRGPASPTQTQGAASLFCSCPGTYYQTLAEGFQEAAALASPWKGAKHQHERLGLATPVSIK